MIKHTPGPWSIFTDEKHKHNAGIEADGFSIICIGYPDETPAMDDSGVCGRTTDETTANAHLISAAPELLEALEAIMGSDLFEWNGSAAFWLQDKVKAAIAKAKGEQL